MGEDKTSFVTHCLNHEDFDDFYSLFDKEMVVDGQRCTLEIIDGGVRCVPFHPLLFCFDTAFGSFFSHTLSPPFCASRFTN